MSARHLSQHDSVWIPAHWLQGWANVVPFYQVFFAPGSPDAEDATACLPRPLLAPYF